MENNLGESTCKSIPLLITVASVSRYPDDFLLPVKLCAVRRGGVCEEPACRLFVLGE